MKWTLGEVIAVPFVAMAAIPIAVGMVIFAPVYVPLAVVNSMVERSSDEQ